MMRPNYVISKIFSFLVVIFVVLSLTFILLRVLPGGPFDKDKKLPPQIRLISKKNIILINLFTINI